MTTARQSAPRDSAAAVLDRHHCRVMREQAALASTPVPLLAAVGERDALPVWTLGGLRAAAIEWERRRQATDRMIRAGMALRCADRLWTVRCALLELVRQLRAAGGSSELAAMPAQTWQSVSQRDYRLRQTQHSSPLEHCEQAHQLRCQSNAPNPCAEGPTAAATT